VRTSDAREMIAVAKRREVKLAVMFQRRTSPLWKKAREIVASGALGRLIRTCMMESHYRTQAYYDSGGWRGTWKDEGGGVLMNQAPHSLDLFVWLGGMPSRVTGRCSTRGHDVEVPDTALALLEYPDGGVGTLYTSTTEFPEMSFFQFVGESGVLEVRDGRMRLGLSAPPAGEMSRTSDEPWDIPEAAWREFDLVEEGARHRYITENFVAAVLDGAPLVAPGEEAARSLELANAITVSSATGAEVTLPLEAKRFDEVLERHVRTAKGRKKRRTASNRVVIPKR
jgi:predicted dehydrogenase